MILFETFQKAFKDFDDQLQYMKQLDVPNEITEYCFLKHRDLIGDLMWLDQMNKNQKEIFYNDILDLNLYINKCITHYEHKRN